MEESLLKFLAEGWGVGLFAMSVVGAIRARLPAVNGGLPVLGVTAVVVLGVCSALCPPVDTESLGTMLRVALFAWFAAIGVPAVGKRIASAAGRTKSADNNG